MLRTLALVLAFTAAPGGAHLRATEPGNRKLTGTTAADAGESCNCSTPSPTTSDCLNPGVFPLDSNGNIVKDMAKVEGKGSSCGLYCGCKDRGLDDPCCPTKDGVYLNCCFGEDAYGFRKLETSDAGAAPNRRLNNGGTAADSAPTPCKCPTPSPPTVAVTSTPTAGTPAADCLNPGVFPLDSNGNIVKDMSKVEGKGSSCGLYCGCKDRGLDDPCCPTKDGVYLNCCFGDDAYGFRKLETSDAGAAPSNRQLTHGTTTPSPTKACLNPGKFPLDSNGNIVKDMSKVSGKGSSCGLYCGCKDRGLADPCCPTKDGVYLNCCFGTDAYGFRALEMSDAGAGPSDRELTHTTATPSPTKACFNPGKFPLDSNGNIVKDMSKVSGKGSSCGLYCGCKDRGLADPCCPTKDGVYLNCCFGTDAYGYR